MAPSTPKLSLVAQFDDLCRYESVLTEGLEEDFIRFAQFCLAKIKQLNQKEMEVKLLQQESDEVKKNISSMEIKLKHARNNLCAEMNRRIKAENERNNFLRQIETLREILLADQNAINDQTRVKLAFLNNTTQVAKQRKSNRRLEKVDESAGSLLSLSDISFDQTDENVMEAEDNSQSVSRKSRSKRSSAGASAACNTKRARKSEIEEKADLQTSVIATTTVSFPVDGEVVAMSKIETVPYGITTRSKRPHSDPSSSESTVKSETNKEKPVRKTQRTFTLPSAPCYHEQATPKTLTPARSKKPIQHFMSSGKLNTRAHAFCSKTVIRPETCSPCGRRIRFYNQALKCQDCRATCHPECKDQVPLPCVPVPHTPTSKNYAGTIADYTPLIPPMVPSLIIHCINEIEKRGLSEVGLYRVSGADREVKELKQKFLKGKGVPNLSRYEIHVLCGTIKDFLRSLSDPLITRTAWHDFVNAAEIKDKEDSQSLLYQAVCQLPRPNRDTLAYISVHLQKVAGEPSCKMPISNLARVFGPTIVGFSIPDPPTTDMIVETKKQHMVMERLLNLESDYWNNFVNVDVENIYPVLSKTPEIRTTPVGTMLGPVPASSTPSSWSKKSPSSWSKKSRERLANIGKTPLTPKNYNSVKNVGRRRNFFATPR